MTRHVDELARHIRRLGNHELNELLLQLPKPRFAALVEVALARPIAAGRAGAAVRAGPGCGWLDGGGLCPSPTAGHPHPRPRPERSAGLSGLDPGRRPGPVQRDLELAASRGRGRRPGLGHAGQWGSLSGPGRLCPRPSGSRAAPAAGRAAQGSVRPAAGCRLRACGDGRMTAVKRCPRCGQVKAAEAFYRRRGPAAVLLLPALHPSRLPRGATPPAAGPGHRGPAAGGGSGPPAPPPGPGPPGR